MLLSICFTLILAPQLLLAHRLHCNVPDEWLFQTNYSTHHFFPGTKWPDGIVKYYLNASLTSEDRVLVQKSFDEYNRKTCIRFQPKTASDTDYTSIEFDSDPEMCGLATFCRAGGYQFTRYGGVCRDVVTMVHELGHTLCLGHEFSRPDRDEYLTFKDCNPDQIPGKDLNFKESGLLYDYESQMAYQCGWCAGGWPTMEGAQKCNGDVTPGLSVLDANKINAFYGCSGCYSHRWRAANSLSATDKLQMTPCGKDSLGTHLYICRGYHMGHIHPGKYRFDTKKCTVAYGGGEHIVNKAEVLTHPLGLGKGVYLLHLHTGIIPSNAVPVGSANGEPWYSAVCPLKINGKFVFIPGKVRKNDPTKAYVPCDGEERTCSDYKVLAYT